MTGLLEEAVRRLETLTAQEQDSVAAQILADLDDERSWQQAYEANASQFAVMANEALTEHKSGRTQPIEDLLNE